MADKIMTGALYVCAFILAFAAAGILPAAYIYGAAVTAFGAPHIPAMILAGMCGAYVSHKCAMAALELA